MAKRQVDDPWLEPRSQQVGSMIVHRDSDISLEPRDESRSSNSSTFEASPVAMGCSSDVSTTIAITDSCLARDNNDASSRSVYSFFKVQHQHDSLVVISSLAGTTSLPDLSRKMSSSRHTPQQMILSTMMTSMTTSNPRSAEDKPQAMTLQRWQLDPKL